MISTLNLRSRNTVFPITQIPRKQLPSYNFICSSHKQNPNLSSSSNTSDKQQQQQPIIPNTHLLKPIILTPPDKIVSINKPNVIRKKIIQHKTISSKKVGSWEMIILCGFGYWIQGFRCFPWLGLNFDMANTLNLNPSTLQLVQNTANLPMVAKPIYGILSDALYIGGAHRIPYISIGALLQVVSWGSLALIPIAEEALPSLMACMLLSNLGASITEVTKDALITEYGKTQKVKGLQSYAFMALAAGGILGNLFGGIFLHKIKNPKIMFLFFSLLLSLQFVNSIRTREGSLGIPGPSDNYIARKSISEYLRQKLSDMIRAISEENILRPLCWIVASIIVVPILSGTLFCYQTQCLKLDASIIGMSKVIGQLMLLLATLLYDRYWKRLPIRKLISIVQIVYAASLLLDLILVKQINLKLGIPNEAYVLCLSGIAETVAQFRLLPFSVLLANLCPRGCEGSLTSFLASALCLSSIVSGFLGVGLASLLGISSGDYSNLTVAIMVQFVAALIPFGWISYVPMTRAGKEDGRKRSSIRRMKKKV